MYMYYVYIVYTCVLCIDEHYEWIQPKYMDGGRGAGEPCIKVDKRRAVRRAHALSCSTVLACSTHHPHTPRPGRLDGDRRALQQS